MNSTCIDTLPLNDLLSTYDKGALVPFIGAGLSHPFCPLWKEFVSNLEREAGLDSAPAAEDSHGAAYASTSEAYIRRSERAVRTLKNRSHKDYVDGISRALRTNSEGAVPDATLALAEMWWPLVITTNYDDLFFGA